jgi:uncharacterized protein (DUF2267 family)
MEYDQFIAVVEQATGEDRERAERAARATLATLAERIGPDQTRHLIPQLAPELGVWLFAQGNAQPIDVAEFVRRVAERERVDTATAERHITAVFLTLNRAVSEDEFSHMTARLPREFSQLLPRGAYAEPLPDDAFLISVADRLGVDDFDSATRAIEAVLETLAERISEGEVDDLISRSPIQLHAALKRGKSGANPAARRMSLGEFEERVAQRTNANPAQARVYARAVLATLRDTVTPAEFRDVTDQLPTEYRVLVTNG